MAKASFAVGDRVSVRPGPFTGTDASRVGKVTSVERENGYTYIAILTDDGVELSNFDPRELERL